MLQAIEGLDVAASDGVLTITFDRPAKRNAITYAMYRALTDLLERATREDEVRCLLFAANGRVFSAGHDLKGFDTGLAMAVEDKPSFGFMRALVRFPKPVVAAVGGDAVGIGATMLLHCDFVYAVPDCRLVFPFAKLGLVPEFASTFLVPRLAGNARAMELFLLDGVCPAERAVSLGIVNSLVAPDQLEGHTRAVAARLAALPAQAVLETKRLVSHATRDAIDDAIAQEQHAFDRLLRVGRAAQDSNHGSEQ